jgi:hypothetical protein
MVAGLVENSQQTANGGSLPATFSLQPAAASSHFCPQPKMHRHL